MMYFFIDCLMIFWWIGAAKSGIDGIMNPISLLIITTLVVVLIDALIGIKREKKEEERLVQECREKYGEAWYQCHLYLQSDEYREQMKRWNNTVMVWQDKSDKDDKNGGDS